MDQEKKQCRQCPCTEAVKCQTVSALEEELLFQLAETPFLPVASNGGQPICLELNIPRDQVGNTLQKLEMRGLIRIDYDMPLAGFDYSDYAQYSLQGSLALTTFGQDILDDMEFAR